MNRHEVDAVSVAFGAIFMVFVAWWLLLRSIDIGASAFGWLAGTVLAAAGALGAFAALRSGRQAHPSAVQTRRQR